MSRLLPAPVSPVMTLRPASNVEAQPVDEREVGDRQLEQAAGAPPRRRVTTAAAPPCGGAGPRTAARRAGSRSRIGRSRARTSTTSPTAIGRSSRPSTETSASCASTTRQRTTCSGLDDDRADRRQVGGDRRDDEVAADRVEDRAAGRERVAGRAGRAGDDEAVGDERREVRVVDARRRAGTRGPATPRATTMSLSAMWRSASSAAPPPRRIRPSRTIRSSKRELAGDDALEHGLELAGLGLRQEADLAEVDAEERDVDLGHGPGRPQERAVAAEDDERVGRRQLAQQRVQVAGLGLPLLDAAHRGTSRRRARAARRRPRCVGL